MRVEASRTENGKSRVSDYGGCRKFNRNSLPGPYRIYARRTNLNVQCLPRTFYNLEGFSVFFFIIINPSLTRPPSTTLDLSPERGGLFTTINMRNGNYRRIENGCDSCDTVCGNYRFVVIFPDDGGKSRSVFSVGAEPSGRTRNPEFARRRNQRRVTRTFSRGRGDTNRKYHNHPYRAIFLNVLYSFGE